MPKSKLNLATLVAETHKREAAFDVATVDAEKRTIELSFSSEIELERWPGVIEVLSHEAGACDLSRLNNGAPLLFNHNLDEVLGVIESATIGADRKGRAVVRFGNSECAQEAFADVQDGILRNVSVGYRIKEIKLDESREDVDRYVVKSWQPYEVSIVSVPADTTVGIGRALEIQPAQTPKTMETPTVTAPAAPTVDLGAERGAAAKAQLDTVRTILEIGEKFGQSAFAQEFLRQDKPTVDSFRQALLDKVNEQNSRVKDATSPIGLNEKEVRAFSLLKLFRALGAESPEDRKRFSDQAKFEFEACRAAGEKMHREVTGTVIPTDILLDGFRANEIVSIKTGTGYSGTGGNTVPTNLLSGSFIDILRNNAVLMQLAQELSGLVGNVDIPKQIDTSTATWVGEDDAGSRQPINFGLVQLRPRTVTNYSEITRRMIMQTSIGIENLVRKDLAESLARTIDTAGFYGTGSANQPTGIKNQGGVLSKTFGSAGAPTFAELVDMETKIATANASVSGMSYVANAKFRGYAKTTRRLSTATDSNTLWEPGGTINGYSTQITNQVADGDVFFGNFSDLLVGMWGGLEVTVDPYTYSDKARIRVVLMQDVDFAIRRAASFCLGA